MLIMGVRALWRYLFSADVQTLTFSEPYKPVNALVDGLFPGQPQNISRDVAMGVPAFKRGRDMICAIGTLPLETIRRDNTVIVNPFLAQVDPNVPNVVTMSQTVDDLLCYSVAWWRITQFASNGFPYYARRYDPLKVSITPPAGYTPSMLPAGISPVGVVWMDGEPVDKRYVIRFDSPNAPVLGTAGRRILARAVAIEDAAEMYATNPRPMDYFTPADPNAEPLDESDVKDMLDTWQKARQTHATAYLGGTLTYNPVDVLSPADLQLIDVQRKVSLDIANLMGVDAEDIGVSTTSRTYQNAVDRRKDRINDTLAAYMRAVTDRLTMGDVTPNGQTVRFVLNDYLKADPKTRAEVQQMYLSMGVTDPAEIREQEGLAPRTITPPARPIPATVGSPRAVNAAAELTAFAGTPITFDSYDVTTFSVDAASRTIVGLAVPYGQSARSAGRHYRFEQGSVQWSDVGRVKLLRDHNHSLAIGKTVSLVDTPAGLVATFKLTTGVAADEALAGALDGVIDGLSIGIDFAEDDIEPDPLHPGGFLVRRSKLREISLTAVPAFDDSRLTSVTASADEGTGMDPEDTTPAVVPADPTPAVGFTFSGTREEFAALMETQTATRTVVDPTTHATVTQEPLPYRFDRGGNFLPTDHVFSGDLLLMARAGDERGNQTDAGRRVMDLIKAEFVNTNTTGVSSLNPSLQRPDMYVDQRDYRYPLWDALGKGAPPNGVQPFIFPKFSSNGTLVADHVEGTEPTAGAFTTTNQTVTPSALSGKASLTREVWDMGGNPAVSTLVFNQMKRSWYEGLEVALGTFLNTLTAAVDINLNTGAGAGVAPTSAQLQGNWESALAALQFIRGYDWSLLAMEPFAYQAFIAAADSTGRKLYPILAPQNANGTAAERFRYMNLAGVTGIPAWGLGAGTGGSPNNSWFMDPSVVWAWSTAPERLEFPGTAAGGGYAPVAMIDIGIWGYKAFACSDIGGVRQVTYDTTT